MKVHTISKMPCHKRYSLLGGCDSVFGQTFHAMVEGSPKEGLKLESSSAQIYFSNWPNTTRRRIDLRKRGNAISKHIHKKWAMKGDKMCAKMPPTGLTLLNKTHTWVSISRLSTFV